MLASACTTFVGAPNITTYGRVVSDAEADGGLFFSRDCGWSRQINERETLWVFCDTLSGVADGAGSWLPGPVSFRGTAALADIGDSGKPGLLRDLPEPVEPLLPLSDRCPDNADRPNLLRWPYGIGPVQADGQVVIFHLDTCFFGGEMIQVRWGGSIFNPQTGVVGESVDVFRDDQAGISRPHLLSSPTEWNGHLYFVSPQWDGTPHRLGNYRAGLARVPVDRWAQAQAYQWWNGSQWQSDADSVAPLPFDPDHFQVAMDRLPVRSDGVDPSVMVVTQQAVAPGRFGGSIDVYEIPNLANPTPRLVHDELLVGDCVERCYHFIPHPEYGGDDFTVLSYFNGDDVLPVGADWQFPTYGHTRSLRLDLGPELSVPSPSPDTARERQSRRSGPPAIGGSTRTLRPTGLPLSLN